MTERHFETHSPVELYVENGKGHVEVIATDTTESRVEVSGHDADQVAIELAEGRLSVVAPKSHAGFLSGERRLDMTVTVPTGSSLTTRLGSADLAATGALDRVRVKSGSGDVSLDVVTGASSLETGSGDVSLATAGGDLQVKSGSGDVAVREAQAEVAVSTGSGDVRLGTAGSVTVVKTGSGDLAVGSCAGDLTMSTGSGDLAVERATRGRLSMKGASGDVHVGVLAGLPVWTDLTTVSGRIRSHLPSTGEPEPGADHLELRARTVSGDITLVES